MDRTSPGSIVDDRYLLEELLGTGGSATVWRGTDLKSRAPVAIKLLHAHLRTHPMALQRLAREAELLERLEHPAIVRAQRTELDRVQPYFVMEHVEGQSLDDRLAVRAEDDVHFDALTLDAIVRPICSALAYAHARGAVHRDIKPSNVRVTVDGARLLDFGLVRLLDDIADGTTRGRVLGTRYYMAPEQLEGEPVDGRADLYALGVVLFELLTLRRAWGRTHDGGYVRAFAEPIPGIPENAPLRILERVRSAARPTPSSARPELDGRWDALVVRATALDPGDRHPDAAAFLDDFERALAAGLPGTSGPGTIAGPVGAATRVRAPLTGDAASVWDGSVGRRRLPLWSAPVLFAAGVGVGMAAWAWFAPPATGPAATHATVDPPKTTVVATPAPRVAPAPFEPEAPSSPPPDREAPARRPAEDVVRATRDVPPAPPPADPFVALSAALERARQSGRGHDALGDALIDAAEDVSDAALRARVRRLATIAAHDGDIEGLSRALDLLKRTKESR